MTCTLVENTGTRGGYAPIAGRLGVQPVQELQYLIGKRYYDADIGRWTAGDPDHQFIDAYAFGPCNPLNGKDLGGRIWSTSERTYNFNLWRMAFNYIAPENFNECFDEDKTNSKGQLLLPLMKKETYEGAVTRKVIQTWGHDPNNPDMDKLHMIGEQRIITQTYKSYNDELEGTQNTGFLPVPDNTYDDVPGSKPYIELKTSGPNIDATSTLTTTE